MSILSSKIGIVGIGFEVTVFQPTQSYPVIVNQLETSHLLSPESIHTFFERACAHIQGQIRLCPDDIAPLHEFVRSEMISLDALPCDFHPFRALLFGANPIKPSIGGREVSSGVSHYSQDISG